MKPIYVTKPYLPPFDELVQQLESIYDSSILTNNGPSLISLEKELKEYLDCNNITVFNNGTIALICALKLLCPTPGKIITTPFTFSATAHSIIWSSHTPVFCDIKSDYTLDPEIVESVIDKDTVGILPVHVFGNLCDTQKFEELGKKYNIPIIYDGAHVFGIKSNDKSAVTSGDACMLSFHATKLYHTVEGGGVILKDKSLLEKLHQIRNFGSIDGRTVLVPGLNGKLSEFHAIVGLLNLKIVSKEIAKRKILWELYCELLADVKEITLPNKPADNIEYNYQYFVISSPERDWISATLHRYDIYPRNYFYPLCSEYPCYTQYSKFDLLPKAEEASKRALALPLYGNLTPEDVIRICVCIKSSWTRKCVLEAWEEPIEMNETADIVAKAIHTYKQRNIKL